MRLLAGLVVLWLVLLGLLTMKMPAPAKVPVGAIVRLHDANGNFFCSGVVVSKTRVITASHCVVSYNLFGPPEVIDAINVMSPSLSAPMPAKVLGFNIRADMAILEGDFHELPKMEYGSDPKFLLGRFAKSEKIIMCGFPYGGRLYCSELRRPSMYGFQFKGLGHLFPGMSGGPVIDMETGIVIAVNTAVNEDFAIVSPLIEIIAATDIYEAKTN